MIGVAVLIVGGVPVGLTEARLPGSPSLVMAGFAGQIAAGQGAEITPPIICLSLRRGCTANRSA
jgi:hypothetical protein